MSTKHSQPDSESRAPEPPERLPETTLPIEVIRESDHPLLTEVAGLDYRAFGEENSFSESEFRELIDNGAVVFLQRTLGGSVVSEAMLTLEAHEQSSVLLERGLPPWLAYCAGAAVDESHRGQGLQRELLMVREAAAQAAGKEGVASSVRQKNLASIRSMLKTGYLVTCDAPGLFGAGEQGDRVVMLRLFGVDTSAAEVDGEQLVELEVTQSDEVDSQYNAAVGRLLRDGYVGVNCRDFETGPTGGERTCLMTFAQTDHVAAKQSRLIKDRVAELQTILDSIDAKEATAG